MSTSFNIMENKNKMKPKKTSSSNQPVSDMKKKMIRFMLIILGIVVIFILILWVLSLFTKKEYSYEEMEEVLKNAAVSYFAEHQDRLPTEDQIVEIEDTTLVASEKMKELSEYTSKDQCSGTVTVEKAGNDYIYQPYLNCGDNYTTKEIVSLLTENVVSEGYGLYHIKDNYIFRGEIVNNYIKLDRSLWRIIKITANNELVLIKELDTSYGNPWDDRYNEQSKYTIGINNYKNSRMKEYLTTLYNNKEEGSILSAKDRKNLTSFNLCIGKRSSKEKGSDNSIECREILENQKIGLLTLSDYIAASTDVNCNSAETPSCQNYNYLANDYSWWLATANSENTFSAYSITETGSILVQNTNYYSAIRPVIQLKANLLYKSGDGSLNKPYKIK